MLRVSLIKSGGQLLAQPCLSTSTHGFGDVTQKRKEFRDSNELRG